jgi:hypothetical protein
MFDSLAWRRECYERYLLGLDYEEEDFDEEMDDFWGVMEDDRRLGALDYDTPLGDLARMADDAADG